MQLIARWRQGFEPLLHDLDFGDREISASATELLLHCESLQARLAERTAQLQRFESQLALQASGEQHHRQELDRLLATLEAMAEEITALRGQSALQATPGEPEAAIDSNALMRTLERFQSTLAEQWSQLEARLTQAIDAAASRPSEETQQRQLHEIHAAIEVLSNSCKAQAGDEDHAERLSQLQAEVGARLADVANALANLEATQTATNEKEAVRLLSDLRQEFNSLRDLLSEQGSATSQATSQAISELRESLTEQAAQLGDRIDAIARELLAPTDASGQQAALAQLQVELKACSDQWLALAKAGEKDDLTAELRQEVEAWRQAAAEARSHANHAELRCREMEAELVRWRAEADQWRQNAELQTQHHHDEERLWHEELNQLRELVQHLGDVMHARTESEKPGEPVPAAAEAASGVADSLLAQFAKLQKDSARRRTRGGPA